MQNDKFGALPGEVVAERVKILRKEKEITEDCTDHERSLTHKWSNVKARN